MQIKKANFISNNMGIKEATMKSYTVWVTTDCNMQCSYCYEGNNKSKNKLDIKTANDILSFIKRTMSVDNSKIIIDFHGGEPLLNFEAIKYLVEEFQNLYGREKGSFGITTNGTLCTDEIADFLCENFTYSLTISIDGIKELHNKHRRLKSGNGTYDLAIVTALKLLHRRRDTRVRMTITADTVSGLSAGVIHLMELGFEQIVPVVDYFDNNWNKEKLNILEEQLVIIKQYVNHDKFLKKDLKINLIGTEKPVAMGSCSGGIQSCHIDPDGRIYPCSYTVGQKEYLMGDVLTGINNEKLGHFQEIYQAQNTSCQGCTYSMYCISTRCKYLNKEIMGEYNFPVPIVCAVENIKLKLTKNSIKIR